MSIFTEIADQWQIADDAFGALEGTAFAANDDVGFDAAGEQRKRNDQAYFLYLFTRLEDSVNKATGLILTSRVSGAPWAERRIWEAWARQGIPNVHFMSKVEILTDKSLHTYATIQEYYKGRNDVAHGGVWNEQFFIPAVAQMMDSICNAIPAN